MGEWREIAGTLYRVSNEGQIESRWSGGWKPIRHALNSRGYPQFVLFDGKLKKSVTVHKYVAEAFLGPRPTPRHQVNHKNGDRADNRVENLEWVTHSENSHHRYDVLGHKAVGPFGEANGQSKLTDSQIREMRARRSMGERHKTIAADFGITEKHSSVICARKRWKHLDA